MGSALSARVHLPTHFLSTQRSALWSARRAGGSLCSSLWLDLPPKPRHDCSWWLHCAWEPSQCPLCHPHHLLQPGQATAPASAACSLLVPCAATLWQKDLHSGSQKLRWLGGNTQSSSGSPEATQTPPGPGHQVGAGTPSLSSALPFPWQPILPHFPSILLFLVF